MASPYPTLFLSPQHVALLEAMNGVDDTTQTLTGLATEINMSNRTMTVMLAPLSTLGLVEVPSKGKTMALVISTAGKVAIGADTGLREAEE